MRLHLLLVTLLSLSLSLGSHAQDNNKASKEREALRRAQAALRAAQEQQSSLQADKAKAEASATAAQKEAAAIKAQVGSSNAKLRAKEQELSTAQAELSALREQLATAQAALAAGQEREQALQQQVLAARQESAGRLQTNQALTGLLERSTQALADAEGKNRQLYTLGQDLVQRYLGRSAVDKVLLEDPVLGLTRVRFEDQAEKLRAELEQRRVVR